MMDLRKRHAELTTAFEERRALDWPLAFVGEGPILTLIRRMLNDAETYLDDGQADAAALSLRVVEDSLRVLTSLYALATEEI